MACARVDEQTTLSDASVQSTVEMFRALHRAPSIQYAVVQSGKVLASGAIGFGNVQAHRRATPATSYEIGSVTKAFIAIGSIVNLRHHGLKDTARIPASATCGHRSTIRFADLIHQQVSYPAEASLEDEVLTGRSKSAVHAICGARSASWHYLNLNYEVLSTALHMATGIDAPTSVREYVLGPLNLRDSGFGQSPGATGYSCAVHPVALPDQRAYAPSAGGLVSTARSIAALDSAVLRGPFGFALTGGVPMGPDSEYADGFIQEADKDGRVAYHDGFISGYSSINVLYLERDTAVVILANCDHLDGLRQLADELMALTL